MLLREMKILGMLLRVLLNVCNVAEREENFRDVAESVVKDVAEMMAILEMLRVMIFFLRQLF